MQADDRQVIALAGVGNFGRYVCEELLEDPRFKVVVISRGNNQWLSQHDIKPHISEDYSRDTVLSILNATAASILISFIDIPLDPERFIDIHNGFIEACIASRQCKRFIPPEYIGNIEDFPLLPGFYATTREAVREKLRQTRGLEWTLFNHGWFMDYFVPQHKTYIKAQPGISPIDLIKWEVCVRGSGDEPQVWTSARDAAKAMVELLLALKWEPYVYVAGDWNTWNEAAETMETFYGRRLARTHISKEEIERALVEHADDEDKDEVYSAQVDQWNISGASACPRETTLRQRAEYFSHLHFSTLREYLEKAETSKFL
ncbi:hypothetical protein MMC12_004862 [Toensbergia leucococca]|nr:hypothetical protein [Toensbergia leucococca]